MIPSRDHPVWKKLILDDTQYKFRFLALKIFMSRIKMKLEFETADRLQLVESSIEELYQFACQYPEFVGPDLKQVIDKEQNP